MVTQQRQVIEEIVEFGRRYNRSLKAVSKPELIASTTATRTRRSSNSPSTHRKWASR